MEQGRDAQLAPVSRREIIPATPNTLLNCYTHSVSLSKHTKRKLPVPTQNSQPQHTHRGGKSKVSQPLGSEQKGKKLRGCEEVKPGAEAEKYPSVCCCPAGWRRVDVPTTSAPGRRQHRAAE